MLFPTVEMKVGINFEDAVSLTPVPPKNLRSFQYTSDFGVGQMEANFLDPNWMELERLFMTKPATAKKGDLIKTYYRFGYLVDERGNRITTSKGIRPWHVGQLKTLTPTFTAAGTEVAIVVEPHGLAQMVKVDPTTYYGTRSDVAHQIAERYNLLPVVEETRDSFLEGNSPKKWPTNNTPHIAFLKRTVATGAVSKRYGIGGYEAYVSPRVDVDTPAGGANDYNGSLHFHPLIADSGQILGATVFNFLYGSMGVVKEWSPDIRGGDLANVGVTGLITKVFDKETKRVVVNNTNIASVKELNADADKTMVEPPADKEALAVANIIALKACSSAEQLDDIENTARAAWDTLMKTIHTAAMSIVGLPEYVYLDAGDVVQVVFEIPGYGLHYSSGFWKLNEVVHNITGGYDIGMTMERAASPQGISDVPGRILPADETQRLKTQVAFSKGF